MKGSSKRSKLPIEQINAKKQEKINKLNDVQDVTVISDANGVRIVSGDKWIGISPDKARQISASLLKAATDSEKLKKDKAVK